MRRINIANEDFWLNLRERIVLNEPELSGIVTERNFCTEFCYSLSKKTPTDFSL